MYGFVPFSRVPRTRHFVRYVPDMFRNQKACSVPGMFRAVCSRYARGSCWPLCAASFDTSWVGEHKRRDKACFWKPFRPRFHGAWASSPLCARYAHDMRLICASPQPPPHPTPLCGLSAHSPPPKNHSPKATVLLICSETKKTSVSGT